MEDPIAGYTYKEAPGKSPNQILDIAESETPINTNDVISWIFEICDRTLELSNSLAEANKDLNSRVFELNDRLAKAQMYTLEMERSNNLKFNNILEKLDKLENNKPQDLDLKIIRASEPSERDYEILNFIRSKGRVCADDVQKKFKYRGRNAASARLSKLFKEDLLGKVYAGRKVYYTPKS